MKFSEIKSIEVKAPIPPDAIPQERITGDVLRGYGPRRGNLERLLRYWRPIMRREGGFRRCRVILADHPELYPLNNICAWLHHETTGLWPNEGCHHPGMKNCRKKIRGVVNGSIWNDREWNDRLARIAKPNSGSKGLPYVGGEPTVMQYVVTNADMDHAMIVLRDFMDMEPKFVAFLRDENNWSHVGDGDDGIETEHGWMKPTGDGHHDCGCGCGGAGTCGD